MIRKSTLNINYANKNKLNQLLIIIKEYKKIVNLYIDKFWQEEKLGIFLLKKENKVNTWLSARMQQNAGKQAIQILKSTRKKDKDKRYKKYKKLYHNCIKNNKLKYFTNKRFSELKLNWKLKPIYNADTIDLDERFIDLKMDINTFDIWIRITSLGNKLQLKIPSRKHKHFNKFYKDISWNIKKSARLRYINNQFYFDIFFEKEKVNKKEKGKIVGFDIGYKKLLSDSEGNFYGKELEKLYLKIANKQKGSKSYKKIIIQKENKINEVINSIEFNNIKTIIIEDLKNLKYKRKFSKKVNNKLQYWSYKQVIDKLERLSDEEGFYLIKVDPAYTSQTCSNCGEVDKSNRKGEIYQCNNCKIEIDSDTNGAINIYKKGIYSFFSTETKKEGLNV